MNAEDQERLQACLAEVAAILYRNTSLEELTDLESLERAARQQLLTHVSPQGGNFFYQRSAPNSARQTTSIEKLPGNTDSHR